MRKHHRGAEHVRSCTECRTAVERERRYLERLRSADIPAASTEFTARLLERTHELAAASDPAKARTAPGARIVAIGASGALAAAGALTAAALVLAGDPTTQAGRPSSLASSQLSLLIPTGITAVPRTGATAGETPDEAASTPFSPSALTAADLAVLRQSGWACPELTALGLHLTSARAGWRQGAPAVELRLTGAGHSATIIEQRAGAVSSTATTGPKSLLTGRPAAEDGFVPAGGVPAGTASGQDAGPEAWVRASDPAGVIYLSRTTSISYFADAGSGAGPGPDEVLPELARAAEAAERSAPAEGPAKAGGPGVNTGKDESLMERLGRGFRVMLGLPGR